MSKEKNLKDGDNDIFSSKTDTFLENNNTQRFMTDKGFSVQDAYMEIGGFGLFHWIASILIMLGFASGQYITLLLSYLELP